MGISTTEMFGPSVEKAGRNDNLGGLQVQVQDSGNFIFLNSLVKNSFLWQKYITVKNKNVISFLLFSETDNAQQNEDV